jgi:apolipoprotein D and lipocalin family protein
LYRLTLALAALALVACVQKAPEAPGANYRPKGGQVYSSAAFDPSRLTGRWQQVAAFGPKGGCKPGGAEFKADGMASYRLCLGGRDAKGAGPLRPLGPGRLAVAGQEWFILWVDGDYRTLAVGTPSGAFGFILNRGGAISADRMTAAREILEWNGYAMASFQRF